MTKAKAQVAGEGKPTRHCRLSEGREGARRILTLGVGKEAFLYWLKPLPDDCGESFELEKFTDGTAYHVSLGEGSCECPGHLRWGRRTVCKHLASLRALKAAGKL